MRSSVSIPVFLLLAFSCLAFSIFGCGSSEPSGTVSGKVTYRDAAAPKGCSVVFRNLTTGTTAFGTTSGSGEYSLTMNDSSDIPTGKYDVTIAPPGAGDMDEDSDPVDAADVDANSVEEEPEESPIPAKYMTIDGSKLSFEVKEGSNQFDIKLED